MKKRNNRLKKINDGRTFRVLVFSLTVFFLVIIWNQRDNLSELPKLGYIGIFLVNFFSSATVLVPLPGIASVFLGGSLWNPLLVGLISGMGSSIGELFGYFVGYGGRGLVNHRQKQQRLKLIEEFFHRTGFITILIFSIIPLPFFDFIGLLAGAFNYPVWKFATATFLGRITRNFVIAWTGARVLPI